MTMASSVPGRVVALLWPTGNNQTYRSEFRNNLLTREAHEMLGIRLSAIGEFVSITSPVDTGRIVFLRYRHEDR